MRKLPDCDAVSAALSAWNNRALHATIPILSHCHESIRALRRLVILSRRYRALEPDQAEVLGESSPNMDPVRALRELTSQLEEIEDTLTRLSGQLASTVSTGESLALNVGTLLGHTGDEHTETSGLAGGVGDTDEELAEDNRLLAQLVEAQASELEWLRDELDTRSQGGGRRQSPKPPPLAEVHSVHDFILSSPLADISANSPDYHRLLEAANAPEGQKVRMGELLTLAGLISKRQLSRALGHQQDGRRRPLGSLLVDLGYANEEAIAQALAAQLSLPFVVLEREFIREGALAKVPAHLARRHTCFPLSFDDHTLSVAMANPLDLIALEDLRCASGMHIRPCVAARGEISSQISAYYR